MDNSEIIQLLLLLAIIILLVASQFLVNKVYKKYAIRDANMPTTGAEIVKKMLEKNNISDVNLGATRGTLDDHYNHLNKTISLSRNSYQTSSIAAIAVSAHETGHAIQDHEGYFMLRLRKILGPFCVVCSKFVWIAIVLGIILQFFDLILIGLILMGITIVFQLITLPVEFDASKRAVQFLKTEGYDEETMHGIKSMLKAAAFTYVASTLASLLQMIRLIIGFNRRN